MDFNTIDLNSINLEDDSFDEEVCNKKMSE